MWTLLAKNNYTLFTGHALRTKCKLRKSHCLLIKIDSIQGPSKRPLTQSGLSFWQITFHDCQILSHTVPEYLEQVVVELLAGHYDAAIRVLRQHEKLCAAWIAAETNAIHDEALSLCSGSENSILMMKLTESLTSFSLHRLMDEIHER